MQLVIDEQGIMGKANKTGRSIHRILRIETTLSQKGCRACQAGGWQAWAMRAPRPRKACFVLFSVLFRFKVGFVKSLLG